MYLDANELFLDLELERRERESRLREDAEVYVACNPPTGKDVYEATDGMSDAQWSLLANIKDECEVGRMLMRIVTAYRIEKRINELRSDL